MSSFSACLFSLSFLDSLLQSRHLYPSPSCLRSAEGGCWQEWQGVSIGFGLIQFLWPRSGLRRDAILQQTQKNHLIYEDGNKLIHLQSRDASPEAVRETNGSCGPLPLDGMSRDVSTNLKPEPSLWLKNPQSGE